MRRSSCTVLTRAAAAALTFFSGLSARADNYQTSGSPTKVASVTTGSNYTHTESPYYDGNGDIIFCELNSSHSNDLLWSYNIATGGVSQIVTGSGGTQGIYTYDATHIVTADRDSRQVSFRSTTNGTSGLSTVVSHVSTISGSTAQFNGPNDLVVDSAGGVYFTDPHFETTFPNTPGVDGVYYIAPGGTTATRVLTYSSNERPNGIMLSPDQKTLYVGLWQSSALFAYSLNTPGSPTAGHALVSSGLPNPDGMTIDPWGNLIVAVNNGITCWSPTGKNLFTLNTGTQVTNVELGPDGKSLYFTAYGSAMGLYKEALIEVPEPASLALFTLPAALALVRRRPRRRA